MLTIETQFYIDWVSIFFIHVLFLLVFFSLTNWSIILFIKSIQIQKSYNIYFIIIEWVISLYLFLFKNITRTSQVLPPEWLGLEILIGPLWIQVFYYKLIFFLYIIYLFYCLFYRSSWSKKF